jgi:predicted SprT family Zn-dependent metalloprotease
MNITTFNRSEIHKALEEKMMECLLTFENHYKVAMPIPQIIVERMGRIFGKASQYPLSVRINQDLCNAQYWDTQLNDTLPHEIAHLVAAVVYRQKCSPMYIYDRKSGWGHGILWKECMGILGLEAKRCGHIDNETRESISLRKVKRGFVYGCPNCQKTFDLTIVLHNRIQQGSHRICSRCKTRIVYKGQRI